MFQNGLRINEQPVTIQKLDNDGYTTPVLYI